jgi:hypothetical protein
MSGIRQRASRTRRKNAFASKKPALVAVRMVAWTTKNIFLTGQTRPVKTGSPFDIQLEQNKNFTYKTA